MNATQCELDPPNILYKCSLSGALAVIERRAAEAPSPLAVAKARGLLIGYDAFWGDDDTPLVEPPGVFRLPIENPASGRRSRSYLHAGRWSGIVARGPRRLALAHRLATGEIEQPESPVWRQLEIDAEQAGVECALAQRGSTVAGTLYDVIRRPEIRPRLAPQGSASRGAEHNPGTRREIEDEGAYFGAPLSDVERDEFLAGDGRETALMFAHRLATDALARPAWYFARRVVVRDERDRARFAADLWQASIELRTARRGGRHPRNAGACLANHRACEFLGLCSGVERFGPDHFQPRQKPPGDDGAITDSDAAVNLITHDRLRCFHFCRRKHFYRHELGVEAVGRVESETAWLGRVLREALAAWWRARAAPQPGRDE